VAEHRLILREPAPRPASPAASSTGGDQRRPGARYPKALCDESVKQLAIRVQAGLALRATCRSAGAGDDLPHPRPLGASGSASVLVPRKRQIVEGRDAAGASPARIKPLVRLPPRLPHCRAWAKPSICCASPLLVMRSHRVGRDLDLARESPPSKRLRTAARSASLAWPCPVAGWGKGSPVL